jgi:hypothetical protein
VSAVSDVSVRVWRTAGLALHRHLVRSGMPALAMGMGGKLVRVQIHWVEKRKPAVSGPMVKRPWMRWTGFWSDFHGLVDQVLGERTRTGMEMTGVR